MACSEAKGWESRSRRETESEQGVAGEPAQSGAIDPKPGDLVTGRLKPG